MFKFYSKVFYVMSKALLGQLFGSWTTLAKPDCAYVISNTRTWMLFVLHATNRKETWIFLVSIGGVKFVLSCLVKLCVVTVQKHIRHCIPWNSCEILH